MTSFDLGLPGEQGPADRLGHWGPQTIIGAIATMIVLALRPPPAGSPAATVLPLLLVVVLVSSWLLMRHHDRRLCEHCMAAMPLDASEAASRLRRRLALVHRAQDRRLLIGYFVVLLGSHVLLAVPTLLPWHLAPLLWAVVQSSMAYLVLCYSAHRRLQPWCPECNGRGGLSHRVIDPVPSGSLGG